MSIRSSLACVALAAVAVVACENSRDRPKTEPTQSVNNTNATVPGPGPGAAGNTLAAGNPIAQAANATSVKLDPAQVKLAPTTVNLIPLSTPVRAEPFGDERLTFIRGGVDVTEVARARDYYLVLFTDPKDTTKQMAGWIYKDAIERDQAKAPAAPSTLPCKAGEVRVQRDHEFCATACVEDGDCAKAAGGVCDGSGKIMHANGATEGHYCVTKSM